MDAESQKHVKDLYKAAKTRGTIELTLDTDDRVLARVTDGIYRQPASAIRELIVNAYDADATEVVVLTDAPRYSEIMVRDNGNGMSGPVLINLIKHIGGSAKRTMVGQELGVTDPKDPRLSPGGRRLIGKIGIGMFSVSQLTRQFTIITKPKSENYRYTAVVTLHRYSDDELAHATADTKFKTGETVITPEEVGEDEAPGTTILLGSLIPRAKEMLQSVDMWRALLGQDQLSTGIVKRVLPIVHTGLLKPESGSYTTRPVVPWKPNTPSPERMKLLSDKLLESAKSNELYAQVENAFDYYYRMVWTLGLSLPLPYVGPHPFDLPDGLHTSCFKLSNKVKSVRGAASQNQATALRTGPNNSAGDAANLETPREGTDFKVEVDGLQLWRPIRFDAMPGTSRALQTHLLFVGGYKPDLTKYDKTQRGGQDLEFTGYFFWCPRVIPKEHNGLLVRINGASGTLFDTTFLNYQIDERQRLKQVMAEIFVSNGLEEALNIDREAFNTAHPHYQILLNWVHNALRQVFNKQKDLESSARGTRRAQETATGRTAIQTTRSEELRKVLGDDEDTVRDVVFTDNQAEKVKAENAGKRVFPKDSVVVRPVVDRVEKVTEKTGQKVILNEERAVAVAQLLDAYGLLEQITPDQQRELLTSILRIFNTGE